MPHRNRSRPVDRSDDPLPEQQFNSWLIAYHDALAAGSAATSRPDWEPAPELLPRVQGARACLQLLERVWPRSPQPTPQENSDCQPAELSFAEYLPAPINRFPLLAARGCM